MPSILGQIKILKPGDKLVNASFVDSGMDILIERERSYYWYQVRLDDDKIPRIESIWLIADGLDEIEMTSKVQFIDHDSSGNATIGEGEIKIRTF
jgi:hypothetical protein